MSVLDGLCWGKKSLLSNLNSYEFNGLQEIPSLHGREMDK